MKTPAIAFPGRSPAGTPDSRIAGVERRELRLLGRAARDVPARAAGGDGGGAGKPPRDPERERESGVATATRPEVKRPSRFKVLLYNDDYTPMEFVVSLLEQIFGKSPAGANQIMLAIHRTGLGVAGVFLLEIAETKVAAVHHAAEERGYPLRAGVEKE